MTDDVDLQLGELERRYAADPSAPLAVLREVHDRILEGPPEVWIHRRPIADLERDLERAVARRARGDSLPLFGVPFAVKDNIDVAGIPTTAACPAFSYTPTVSATAVERLVRAGAIVLGKTNLDQFATGLVGVRSPFGAVPNAFDSRFISGGSSSGSAIAVATGMASFSLGTDTAGSGRVPAALNNIVGLKPTCGLVSTLGVVPACRTLDCVSVFAANAGDAARVLDVCAGFDPADIFSRDARAFRRVSLSATPRLGVPRAPALEFFGDTDAAALFSRAVARFERLGATIVEIDLAPFQTVAELLYASAFVSERLVAPGRLLAEQPDALHPVLRRILEGALAYRGVDTFLANYRLAELRRVADAEWTKMDALLLPTTPTTYRIEDVLGDPIELNRRLGYYTNFVNLLDLTGVAVPAGFRADGQPLGVTVLAPAFSDRALLELASRFHAGEPSKVGATAIDVSTSPFSSPAGARIEVARIEVAVVGAHLQGEPLHHQLTSRGATLVKACRTAKPYRLYALAGTVPPKPGLVFEANFDGPGIEVEVWALDVAAFGSFVDEVGRPLAIGSLVLDDGSTVKGFVCEPYAVVGATEITTFGGWRAYRRSLS